MCVAMLKNGLKGKHQDTALCSLKKLPTVLQVDSCWKVIFTHELLTTDNLLRSFLGTV